MQHSTATLLLQMVLCITTGFVRPTRLEILLIPMKRVAPLLWQNQPLLLQRQCHQVKSTLPGLIIQLLRRDTRLNEKGYSVARIRRSRRWVQTCKAIAIQPDLTLTPNIITGSGLPTEHLIPITRTNRLLRRSHESLISDHA